ncbi:MAG: glycosyltransferase [Fibrobacterota bacterium]|nr:glycosyltransferase [Fibrobacterota bacterium]
MTPGASKKTAPLVSIGLPVYNGQKYLEACLKNLLAQTWADFEIIISDNASTDGTAAICERFATQDPRVRYYREDRNRGAAWNYTNVLNLASGRYFRWSAYDDLISPDFVEVCVKRLDEDANIILCYGLTVIIDADGNEGETKPDRIHINHPRPSSRLREYLHKVGLTNAIYGLMRIDNLRKTSGMGSFPGADIVLLAELALHGCFREERSTRFYRRIHPQASLPSNPSLNQLLAWYKPEASKRLVLHDWEHFLGYLAAIRGCPISTTEKLRCFAVLLAWKRHGWRKLLSELILGIRYILMPFSRTKSS